MTIQADENQDSAFTSEEAMKLVDDALYGESDTKQAGDSLNAGTEEEKAQQQEEGKPTDEGNAEPQGDAEPAPVDESELNAENAVIVARDGKHTIPFERLSEARQSASEWKQLAEQREQQLQQLIAQASERQAAGEAPTEVDRQVAQAVQAIEDGVDMDYFGSFDEEDLAKGIMRLVSEQVGQAIQQHVEPIKQKIDPLTKQQEEEALQRHNETIYTAHPDANSIVHSNEFAQWRDQQPGFQQAAIQQVLERGTAQDVVDLLTAYKDWAAPATASGSQQQSLDDVKAKAAKAVSQAQQEAPSSLTDIPGGRAAAPTREEAMDDMDPLALVDAMTDMSPEQLERYLNRM